MTTQPLENRETLPTQTQPMMPTVGGRQSTAPRKQTIKNQPMHAESAQILRQNSLRKQRKAQKANALHK
jgi:hypothetical protein